MNCPYCNKKCTPGSSHEPQYNRWICYKCLEYIVFSTEKRDDAPRVIEMTFKFRDKDYVLTLNHDKQETILVEEHSDQPLARFNYVAKLNPGNLKRKMRTMVTFS